MESTDLSCGVFGLVKIEDQVAMGDFHDLLRIRIFSEELNSLITQLLTFLALDLWLFDVDF